MNPRTLETRAAHPLRLQGPLIEAALDNVCVGEICEIRPHWRNTMVSGKAQVIGFKPDTVVLSLLGNPQGLSRESLLVPTGRALTMTCGMYLLGCVVDARGEVVERLAPVMDRATQERLVNAAAPAWNLRRPVSRAVSTGVRVIDALLTCGIGQRVGIFASAGAGKTTLVQMLISHMDADVFVVALVGERGREVTEFVETLRHSSRSAQCVVVYATSDFSSVDRCNAALQATTIAEYFRDQGRQVVLLVDSITRYARARRDLALAAGEAPARRGYPASVFDTLPGLLERPGVTVSGSITAFYTVLLESDDDPDPVAEEIRSILDGHFHLSRTLGGKGHFPAVDVLRSASRVARQVTDAPVQALATRTRTLLARLEELQLLLDMGEYVAGQHAANDHAIQRRVHLEQWMQQAADERSDLQATLESLHEIVG